MYGCECVRVCSSLSEELYEDETFPERELSALVVSKVKPPNS